MNFTEDLFNEIDAYLNKRMTPAQQSAFEQRMRQNADLRQEVLLQQHLHRGLETARLKRQFTATRTAMTQRRKLRRATRLASALVLLVLALIGGNYFIRPYLTPPTQEAFAAYYEPESPAREETTLPAGLPEARADYYDGHYENALRRLNQLPVDSLQRITYYRGLTYIALKRPQDAIRALAPALASPDTIIRQQALRYTALAYLQANDALNARRVLMVIRDASQPPHPYREQAIELLERIR